MRWGLLAAIAVMTLAPASQNAFAASAKSERDRSVARIQRGVLIARTHCARCHSIDKASPSPVAIAPAFRDLHKRYPVDQLEEPLAEGLVTGHPSMPEFAFEPDQIEDFITFLKSLE